MLETSVSCTWCKSQQKENLQTFVCRWQQVANLSYHSAPVLSLAHVRTCLGQHQIVFSGATDGAVAVWDCAAHSGIVGDQQPLLALPGMHQSGVNAMSAAVMATSEGALQLSVAFQDIARGSGH